MAHASAAECAAAADAARSDKLRAFIEEYFREDDVADDGSGGQGGKEAAVEDAARVRADIRQAGPRAKALQRSSCTQLRWIGIVDKALVYRSVG